MLPNDAVIRLDNFARRNLLLKVEHEANVLVVKHSAPVGHSLEVGVRVADNEFDELDIGAVRNENLREV